MLIGSVAAWAQSFMGGTVVKGSLFYILQSASIGGIWAGPLGAVGEAAGAAYGYYVVNCDDYNEEPLEQEGFLRCQTPLL